MKVNIYKTGTHSPKTAVHSVFQPLINTLNSLDTQQVPLSSVQHVFSIKDVDLRKQIQEAINSLQPVEKKAEQYCEYSFRLEDGPERLVVKQYTSGRLQVQGYAGDLYKQVLEIIIPRYNLRYPNAVMRIEDYLKVPDTVAEKTSTASDADTPPHREPTEFPYVGTDESGKGDYFGPLVIAAVWLDQQTQKRLEAMGVRDSKLLSDQKCRELASTIRTLCPDKYQEVEITPERYNSLYEEFKSEGKNLNHLLAWGHARALESILDRHRCQYAVADQFGDEQYIRSKLMEKRKMVRLVQTPKAERYVAVAAASMLARDRFLARLQELGQNVRMPLPKGASPAVVEAARNVVKRHGPSALRRIAKTHFKTTAVVLGKE